MLNDVNLDVNCLVACFDIFELYHSIIGYKVLEVIP